MSDKLADEGAEIDKVLYNIWWQKCISNEMMI